MPQEDSALLLYSELFRLWHITMRRMIGPTLENAERQHNERLIKILSFIQQHYMEKISLEQVAQQVHFAVASVADFLSRLWDKQFLNIYNNTVFKKARNF